MIIHKVETAPASPQVIIQKAEYICEYCKKSILEDDLVKQNISVKGGYIEEEVLLIEMNTIIKHA